MLARLCGPDGRGVSIHSTFLTQEGLKADVPNPKKLLSPATPGACAGAAVRLFEPESLLAVAEGIETALAVHLATGLPTWSAISAGGLRTLILPPEVREVIICADHDSNGVGQAAGAYLATRLLEEGRRVRLVLPPETGTDWNDYVMSSHV
jgi:putative DNA primase/helicase